MHAQLIAVTVNAGDFGAGVSAAPGLKPELRKALDDFVSQNKIVLFMKGTQQVPHMCPVHVTSSMIQPLPYIVQMATKLTWGPCLSQFPQCGFSNTCVQVRAYVYKRLQYMPTSMLAQPLDLL